MNLIEKILFKIGMIKIEMQDQKNMELMLAHVNKVRKVRANRKRSATAYSRNMENKFIKCSYCSTRISRKKMKEMAERDYKICCKSCGAPFSDDVIDSLYE